MKKFMDYLFGLKMTIVSGIFLVFSLVLMLMDKELPIDPAWVTIIISGIPMIHLALTRLIYEKWISSALLISIAMVASIAIGELFAAGEVAFIMAIGAILEDMTVARARKGLSTLVSLMPQQGRKLLKSNGIVEEKIISIEEISKNDILRVLPGETIPVDGIVIDGNSSIDQSIITGESLPIDKTIDDSVFCGTINRYGSIDIKATQVGKDSSLQKMINMVKEAEDKKAPMQKTVDKWATWLVPIALCIAVLAYIITKDITRAVTILVVFCPCALALATPTSIIAAIGQATKHGVLIKSGEALELMGKVNSIAFDKTGTLTFGNLTVTDIISLSDITENDLIVLAASVEKKSEHPLAKSIVKYTTENKLIPFESENFQMIAGKGVSANINDKHIICGNESYLNERNIDYDDSLLKTLNNLRIEGKASIIVAENKNIIGIIGLSDTIRPTAKSVVERLYKLNTEIVLLTGDNKLTAEFIGNQVGIKNIKSNLLPEEKVAGIETLQKNNKIVCMIGDGVNDAPALKLANVGIAMGSMGSDIAIEAADIALMSDDIDKIPYIKNLSNATLKTIKFNITASMIINFGSIILSLMGVLNPITGALVHNAGSVLVVLNAALLYDRNFDK